MSEPNPYRPPGELVDPDAELARVVPKPPKSIALVLAQLLFLVLAGIAASAMLIALSAGNVSYIGGAFVTAAIPGLIALIVGVQRRQRWAHYAATILIALVVTGALFQGLSRGGFGDTLITNVLLALLAWRVGFGEPSRAYFAGKPVARVPSFEEG